jgi:hypothetical protein
MSADGRAMPGRRALLRHAGILCAMGALAGFPVSVLAQSPAASVVQMRLERGDDGIYLNATVEFLLPASIQEVLEKGIAIHFVAEAEVFRERWYWTDRKVAQAVRHVRLAYQPLTRRWRINVVPTNGSAGLGVLLNQNFDSLDDALGSIRRIGRLRLGDAGDLGDEAPYRVVFRFRLDTSQLPRPFQIGLVGSADWDVAAERSARLMVEKGL